MLLNPEVDTSRSGPSAEQLPQSTGLSRTQGSAGLARETGGELCLPAARPGPLRAGCGPSRVQRLRGEVSEQGRKSNSESVNRSFTLSFP